MTKTSTQHPIRYVEGLTRDEVCVRYRSKVMLLARRVHERLAPDASVTLDDLVSSGALGLLEAFDRFDEGRGIRFGTFAEYRIRGAMYDDLRKGDTFTRRRRELAKRIDEAHETMRRRLGREPNDQEVADYMGVTLARFHSDVAKVQPISHVSIDRPLGDQDDARPLVEQITGNSIPLPDTGLKVDGIRSALKDAISELPDRQRHCVQMYYGKEMSLKEIADVYGVTVSRISQILKQARGSLRKRISVHVDGADLDKL